MPLGHLDLLEGVEHEAEALGRAQMAQRPVGAHALDGVVVVAPTNPVTGAELVRADPHTLRFGRARAELRDSARSAARVAQPARRVSSGANGRAGPARNVATSSAGSGWE